MKKNILIVVFVFFGLFSLISLFFNYKYPFVNPVIGKWSVGFSYANEALKKPTLDGEKIITYSQVDSLLGKEGHYIADPFFIREKDSFYLFVELKGEKDADIALFTSNDGNKYEFMGVVLDEDFHLSFPQVFRYKEEIYMLPETSETQNVILYKASEFPYKWKKSDTLIYNKNLKDPALLLSEDLNLIVAVDENTQQYMFTADSLTGIWKEAANYKSRLGNETRPGGRFFKYNGSYFLPIQDRRYGYGSAISLFRLINGNKKLELIREKKEYLHGQEKIQWFNRGMHHLDVQRIGPEYYMVYDGDYNEVGETNFQYKRTLKFIFSDIYNWLE